MVIKSSRWSKKVQSKFTSSPYFHQIGGDYYQDTKCQNLNGQQADYKSVVKGQVQNLFVLKTIKQEPEDDELHLHTT